MATHLRKIVVAELRRPPLRATVLDCGTLAAQYEERGKWMLAAEAYTYAAELCRNTPILRDAAERLRVKYQAAATRCRMRAYDEGVQA